MKPWGLGALMLLAVFVAGCGSNSATVGVTVTTTVTGATTTSVTLLESTSAQMVATVTGGSSNTVFWQICKPSAAVTIQPTQCSQGVGPAGCTIPTVSNPTTGLGTITPNGLYTAPSAPPSPDGFWVVATSCIDKTAFGVFTIIVDSGIRVRITPTGAAVGTNETFQFTATVTGTANPAVSWSLCTGSAGNLACGSSSLGSISPSGLFQAPNSAQSVIVQAISGADQNQSAIVAVSVVTATAPSVTKISPSTVAQGSVQQDVYLTGTNFLSTSSVIAGGVALPTANVVFVNSTLVRATIPAAQLAQAGTLQVGVEDQEGNPPSLVNLSIVTVRPGVVGSSPDSVGQNPLASPNVLITGGFFATPTIVNTNLVGTTATFNGQDVSATVTSSRQLSLSIPTGSVTTPGLYPIVVQNSGLLLGNPVSYTAALNLGVTPVQSSIPSAAVTSVGVGANPSAVAIDTADGFAVVANGDGTVSRINLATDTTIGGPIPVGNQPTGIAVDDLLPNPIALVVCSTDQTVWTVDLKSGATVGAPLSVSIGPANTSPIPYAVGINPLTHRAIIVYQSTNQATILDLASGAPTVVQQVGGGISSVGTGSTPGVAIDPRLNWAIVAPGGSGTVSLVDLGVDPGPGQPAGRTPQVIAAIAIATTVQGVGVNQETHEAFVSDPQTGVLRTFSLLDYTVSSILNSGVVFIQKGFGAAAVSPLENVGIAVGSASTAVIVNLENNTVLQTVSGLGSSPSVQAVAVDAVTNQAVVVNSGGNSVSIVSLGNSINPLQIVEASPQLVFGGSGTPASLLTVTGSGFVAGSKVFLDSTQLATAFVSSRELRATIPANMLAVPQRFAIQVQNPGSAFSNVADLAVVQPVAVGDNPIGVAIDTDRDLAIVTNSDDGTVSLIALTPQTPIGPTQTPAGGIGLIPGAITVGTVPEGVAVISRLGKALVVNNGSTDASVVDLTQTVTPLPASLCSSTTCPGLGPISAAINPDSGLGVVTDTNPGSATSTGNISTVDLNVSPPTGGLGTVIDHNPIAVAIDPNPLFPYAAVATSSGSSSVDLLNLSSGGSLVGRASGLVNPSGIIFDPVNQVFVAANSLQNQVVLIDPATAVQTPVRVGIGPTSLDYNYQDSTLVTLNTISHTLSVLSYVCPPSAGAPACLGPQVRSVLGIGGTQAVSPVFGPNAVAVDPILNLAVVVDQGNSQVLLVPLPH